MTTDCITIAFIFSWEKTLSIFQVPSLQAAIRSLTCLLLTEFRNTCTHETWQICVSCWKHQVSPPKFIPPPIGQYEFRFWVLSEHNRTKKNDRCVELRSWVVISFVLFKTSTWHSRYLIYRLLTSKLSHPLGATIPSFQENYIGLLLQTWKIHNSWIFVTFLVWHLGLKFSTPSFLDCPQITCRPRGLWLITCAH